MAIPLETAATCGRWSIVLVAIAIFAFHQARVILESALTPYGSGSEPFDAHKHFPPRRLRMSNCAGSSLPLDHYTSAILSESLEYGGTFADLYLNRLSQLSASRGGEEKNDEILRQKGLRWTGRIESWRPVLDR